MRVSPGQDRASLRNKSITGKSVPAPRSPSLNPTLKTLNPKPHNLNLNPQTPNHKPQNPHPKSQIPNPKPLTSSTNPIQKSHTPRFPAHKAQTPPSKTTAEAMVLSEVEFAKFRGRFLTFKNANRADIQKVTWDKVTSPQAPIPKRLISHPHSPTFNVGYVCAPVRPKPVSLSSPSPFTFNNADRGEIQRVRRDRVTACFTSAPPDRHSQRWSTPFHQTSICLM